jgi:hypothetical protein
LIQRFLYSSLIQGLKDFADPNRRLFEKLFDNLYGLTPKEIAGIKEVFRKTPPQVVHNMSPVNTALPAYVVSVGSEAQVGYFLGNDGGYVPALEMYDPTLGQGDVFSSRFMHNYTVHCYAKNLDVAQYMYEVAKAILFLQVPNLSVLNCIKVAMAGQDVAVSPEYAPDYVFCRVLEFKCEREFRFSSEDIGTKFQVIGASIQGGSPTYDPGDNASIVPTKD